MLLPESEDGYPRVTMKPWHCKGLRAVPLPQERAFRGNLIVYLLALESVVAFPGSAVAYVLWNDIQNSSSRTFLKRGKDVDTLLNISGIHRRGQAKTKHIPRIRSICLKF